MNGCHYFPIMWEFSRRLSKYRQGYVDIVTLLISRQSFFYIVDLEIMITPLIRWIKAVFRFVAWMMLILNPEPEKRIKEKEMKKTITLTMLMLTSLTALLANDFQNDRASNILANANFTQYITLDEMMVVNRMVKAKDSWAVSSQVGDIVIADGGTLTSLSDHFQQNIDAKLGTGIWWNANPHAIYLKVGENKGFFKLPPGSTIAIDMYTEADAKKRPVMLHGAARNDRELQDLMQSDPHQVRIIRMNRDWNEFVSRSNNPNHPLFNLDDDQLEALTNAIVFKNGGVASIPVGILQRNISHDDMKAVLRILGLSIEYMMFEEGDGEDRENSYCPSEPPCAPRTDWICTSNC